VTLGSPASLWGLLAIPLLVALYLLRVRRREHTVSSILLWQRAAPAQAGSRPRRIERSLLLLLQILIAATIVAGLARPAVVGRAPAGADVLIVLDASMSMRARDAAPTRFDRARAEALDMVARLRPGQRAAVVLAALRPLLLAPLTPDRTRLRAALAAASPWDAVGDVAAAVTFAAAQQAPGRDGRVVVWTDAAHGALPALPHVLYRRLGTSDDNVGITRFRVLRDPGGTEALVRVQNFGGRDRDIPLDVQRAGTPIFRTVLSLPAGASSTIAFPVSGAGVLRARLEVHDALPEDDEAVAILDPTPLPSTLLVTPGNPYISRILALLPVARAAETHGIDPSTWTGFDVVILDRVTVGALPPGNYLIIGTVPPNLPVTASGLVPQPGVASWDRTDPVLRFVTLDGIRIDRALALAPEEGRVLAGGRVPLLWAYDGRGIRALLLGFALEDSDLPLHVAFPVLMANSLAWLAGGGSEMAPGDAFQLPAGGADEAVVTLPAGGRQRVRATDGMFVLPPFTHMGLYGVSRPSGDRWFAVGPGAAPAGLIRPGEVPGAGDSASRAAAGSAPSALLSDISLWPWCLLAALAAAAGEWALAMRRRAGDV
jgi:Ca-activated chloride channel homolog